MGHEHERERRERLSVKCVLLRGVQWRSPQNRFSRGALGQYRAPSMGRIDNGIEGSRVLFYCFY